MIKKNFGMELLNALTNNVAVEILKLIIRYEQILTLNCC